MTRIEQIRYLNKILLDEMPEFKEKAELYGQDIVSQRRLLRSLMNLRMPECDGMPQPSGRHLELHQQTRAQRAHPRGKAAHRWTVQY